MIISTLTHPVPEKPHTQGARLVLDKEERNKGFLYLVLHVSKVCHLLCRLSTAAVAMVAFRNEEMLLSVFFVLPSQLSRKLARWLSSRINSQSAAFNRAVTPRTVLGLRAPPRTEQPRETTSYCPRHSMYVGGEEQERRKNNPFT